MMVTVGGSISPLVIVAAKEVCVAKQKNKVNKSKIFFMFVGFISNIRFIRYATDLNFRRLYPTAFGG